MSLLSLLEGYTGSTPTELETHIKNKATELKLKVLIDDGEKNIYIPKSRLDEEIRKKDNLQEQLDTQKEALDSLSTLTEDNKKAKSTITELNGKLESLQAQAEKDKLHFAIKSEIVAFEVEGKQYAPHDVEDIMKYIDLETVTLSKDGKSAVGVLDQVKSLTETKGYLFNVTESANGGNQTSPGTGVPGRPPGGHTSNTGTSKPGDIGLLVSSFAKNGLGATPPATANQQGANTAPVVDHNYFFTK